MKKQVWVVEDDPDIGDIISFLLTEDGYEVSLFENAAKFEAALAQDQSKIDIFLMDVMLPDGNGIELCEKVKSSEDFNKVPVLIMSAHTAFSKVEGFCRADDFIPKPFNIDELSAKVKRLTA